MYQVYPSPFLCSKRGWPVASSKATQAVNHTSAEVPKPLWRIISRERNEEGPWVFSNSLWTSLVKFSFTQLAIPKSTILTLRLLQSSKAGSQIVEIPGIVMLVTQSQYIYIAIVYYVSKIYSIFEFSKGCNNFFFFMLWIQPQKQASQ